MAEDNQTWLTIIPDAGHNAHLENPTYFAEKIENIVLKIVSTLREMLGFSPFIFIWLLRKQNVLTTS